jgi:predicted NUDIX family phosphoesterase
MKTESVMVVPASAFASFGYFQGFRFLRWPAEEHLAELLSQANIAYRPRPEVEVDPSFKQIIPYCIFQYTGADGRVTLFQYRRGRGQGETRLHAKRSIGVGGHISAEDGATHPSADPYQEGLRRELAEEVSIETSYYGGCVGMINDDQTDVGRVHLGIVHLFEVAEPAVFPREADLLDAVFCPLDELLAQKDEFENWSQLCLEYLF